MIDVPETQHHKPERGRLTARGRRTDDGSRCTLLVIHEVDGSWVIHGLGAPGVRLSKATWSPWPEISLRVPSELVTAVDGWPRHPPR